MSVNPLVITGAGLPGAADSYYSQEETLAVTGGGAFDLVPYIGWLLIVAVANIKYSIKIAATPTYVDLIAANTGGVIWSDGTNIFASKSSGGAGSARFFVLQHRP